MTINITKDILVQMADLLTKLSEAIEIQPTVVEVPVKQKETPVLETPSTSVENNSFKEFILSRTKTVHRKKSDTTKLALEDYRWIKNQRKTSLADLEWQDFANNMNELYGVNKSKNTWYNIVERKTEYLQTLDY